MADIKAKIDRAVKFLRSIPQDGPIEVAYSTGKDSDVILELTRMSGIPHTAIYKNTTVDQRGSIHHAREMGVTVVQPKRNMLQIIENNGCWVKKADADKVHSVFMQIESFMRKHRIGVFGLPQSGDFFGGNGRIYLRKVMNCTFYLLPYIYRGERGVQDDDTSMFCGILNEGLFTGSTGDGVGLMQTPSATAMGGLTDLYNENKLLNKALVVPIQFPSAVYAERQYMNGGRLHHHIVYRNLAPVILRIPHAKSNIAWDSYEEDYPFTNEPKRKAYVMELDPHLLTDGKY